MRELARSQGDSCQSSAYNVLDFAIVFFVVAVIVVAVVFAISSVVSRRSSIVSRHHHYEIHYCVAVHKWILLFHSSASLFDSVVVFCCLRIVMVIAVSQLFYCSPLFISKISQSFLFYMFLFAQSTSPSLLFDSFGAHPNVQLQFYACSVDIIKLLSFRL